MLDKANYTAKAGSVDAELLVDYLDTLEQGKHTIEFDFVDGKAAGTFSVIKNAEPDKPIEPENGSKTGDETALYMWVVIGIAAAAVIIFLVLLAAKRRKRDEER